MHYRFTVDYRSGLGVFQAGEIVEIDDETAAWLLRDVAGCIEPVDPVDQGDAPERQQEAQHDRQVKRAPRTR